MSVRMPGEILAVTDPSHEGLRPYVSVRERDLVGRERSFVAEGEVVVRVLALRGRYRIRSLLLEERRVDAVRDIVERLPNDVPVYVVSQEVMNEVVGFNIHRGVLALGDRGEPLDPNVLASRASLVVALVGLTNHDNVGSIFRNAAAFGVDAVLLDDETCDPLYRKAIRVSAGTALVVPFARAGSAATLVELVERAGLEPLALAPRAETTLEGLVSTRPALFMGSEGPGLPAEVLSRARPVRIDMAPGLDSLNVAVASGIALYATRRVLATC